MSIYQLGLDFVEVFRFICGQRLLVRQIALVLNRKLVDTVGFTLVDLTHPNRHVAEYFLACGIVDYGDVLCASVSIEHVRRDLELVTVVQHCRNLLDFVGGEFVSTRSTPLTAIVIAMFELSHTHCC